MKYCMSGRHSTVALREADEIKMKYVDKERAIDFIKEYPEKTIIIEIPKDIDVIDWTLLDAYNDAATIILCLYDLRHVNECVEHNMKFYWAYPITSYYELKGIMELKPYYLLLGAPLCFDLEAIHQKTGIYIRLVANIAYEAYIPRENGICGQWIRPEDIKYYEPYVNAIEFAGVDLTAEKTLVKIYKNDQEWPGNLNALIKNLNYDVDSRALPDEFGQLRVRCGQRCMSIGTCHYCQSAFIFANKIRDTYNEMQQKKEN